MTIDNSMSVDPAAAGDLLDRVRRAHDRALESSEATDAGDVERPPLSDDLREAERRVVAEVDAPIEREMIATACEVVAGQYETADQVRAAVVDTVVDARYDDLVAGRQRDDIVAAVRETLTGDATFRAEVENMLVHAARRLGDVQDNHR